MNDKDLLEVEFFRNGKKVTVRYHNTPQSLIGEGLITENDFVRIRSDFVTDIAAPAGDWVLYLHGTTDCNMGVIEKIHVFRTQWEALRFVEETEKLIEEYNENVLKESAEYYLRLKGLTELCNYVKFDKEYGEIFIHDKHERVIDKTKFTKSEINKLVDKFPDFPWGYVSEERVTDND